MFSGDEEEDWTDKEESEEGDEEGKMNYEKIDIDLNRNKRDEENRMSDIIPTKDKREIFMRAVYDWASLSKDPRTKIGAVIAKDDIPISSGFNNFCRGVKDFKGRYEDREIKYNFIVHAELNSILNAASLGRSTAGATLYTQGVPCANCMKAVINSKVSKIICHKEWPNLTYSPEWVKSFEIAEIMRNEAGVELEWYSGYLGVNGYLDGKVIDV